MSNKPKIVVVIPTVRPEQYKSFISAWKPLFEKHSVILVTVWDGESPAVTIYNYGTGKPEEIEHSQTLYHTHKSLVYRYTDACRNLGFIVAAHLNPDYILTLDDDVEPVRRLHEVTFEPAPYTNDPIQSHINVLQKKVPLGWMNTAHDTDLYLRGVPYSIREEAPVMLSHGVWVGTPDFDGETQLGLENCVYCDNTGKKNRVKASTIEELCEKCQGSGRGDGVPYSLSYYVGPIPRGVLFPICGMNVMIRKEALPYFYFAPMGPDTRQEGLNRFSDIWCGIHLKREFDRLSWACYTGGSTILHTRASDAKKNYEQEKLGREWTEKKCENKVKRYSNPDDSLRLYDIMYREKRDQFKSLIHNIFLNNKLSKLSLIID